MAKLTERVSIANGDISDDDLIHIVHDAGGTPISYKMTVGQLKTFISAITGSGVDNQIAVYNGTDTIEGDASLTWDGNTITVTGDASNKAQLTLDSDSTQNAVINLNTNGGASNSVIQFQVSDLTKYMVGINGEDTDATNQMFIITNGDSFDDDGVIVMKPNGNVGVGLGNSGEPSANLLEVGGADTTNASLKIREQSGTPTTPESGQLRNDAGAPMWYDGTQWVDLAKFTESLVVAVSDETTALTTGTNKITFRMPYAFTLTEVRASLTTAGTTSGTTTVDINEAGVSILSTKLTIDFGEKTSTTASTDAVISDSALADDAEITVDIDAISGGATETGLKIYLIGNRT